MRALSASLWLVAVLACAAVRADGDPGRAFHDDVLAYADWCRAEGLSGESHRAYLYLLQSATGKDSLAGVHAGAEAGLKELAANPLLAPGPTARSEHRKKVREMLSRSAARYMEKAERLKAAGDAARADEAVRTALVIDEDLPAARAWRGERKVEGFGWLPAEEAQRIAANTVDLARLPPPAVWEAQDAKHLRWEDAWVLVTPHYAIRSNRPLAEIVVCGRLCEMLYASFFDLARGAFDRPTGRAGVCYLADKADYDRLLAGISGDAPFPPHNVVGFYDHARRICIVQFRGAQAREGTAVSRDEGTLLHECVHQLVHLGHAGAHPTRLAFLQPAPTSQVHFWAVEGIACLFESSRVEGGRIHLNRAGTRYAAFARRQASGWKPDLSRWMAMGQQAFMEESGVAANYEMAAALAHFFVHCADGRKYRSKFFKLLSACYRGEAGLETFGETFRTRLDVLAGEFEIYVRETWPPAPPKEGE